MSLSRYFKHLITDRESKFGSRSVSRFMLGRWEVRRKLCYHNIMKLTPLEPTDPRLRLACQAVSRTELRTKAFQVQIDDLLSFVYGQNNKGISRVKWRPMTVGLSANQVGIMRQVSIIDLAIGHKNFSDLHVLINPVISRHGKSLATHNEGCVNLASIWGSVERYTKVTVKALDRSGNKLTLDLTGWPAVLLQHEIDHLQGRLFIDRLRDATKAHFVADDQMKDYNKKSAATWPDLIDVTELSRPV